MVLSPRRFNHHHCSFVHLVRDGWENKKADFEAQLLSLLGTAWTFDVNPLAIYPYAEPDSYGQRSLGDCIAVYVPSTLFCKIQALT